MSNKMFTVSVVDTTEHAEILMAVTTGHNIKTCSLFAHQLQTAIRCLNRLKDMRHDNMQNQNVSDSEIELSIESLNDLLNLQ